MKKFLIRLTVVLSIATALSALFFGVAILYAKKNIDYGADEELFRKAKADHTVYYYAYTKSGELEEVYKSLKSSMREWTDFDDIGENLKKGFIAVEDREFYEHTGINYRRTAIAILNHIFKFRKSFGASTITQQVVKNISGDNEASISRKVKEIFRALNLEKKHSKDDIFELYLNVIPMAGNVYGVGAASEIYFNKLPSELTVAEAATLIGITNAPTKYNPYTNHEACIEKRNRVLYAMLDFGAIDRGEYDEAVTTPLTLSNESGKFGISPWFIEVANDEVIKDISCVYGVSEAGAKLMLGGSRVVLTMNPEIQKIMEEYFSNVENLSPKLSDGLNYSMVVTNPYNGDLLGIIGNGGKKDANLLFNYATAPVTPGSVLKPLALYAPLIEDGSISWSYMLEDSPTRYLNTGGNDVAYPRNTPDIYEGWIDVNDALKKSKNTVAIRLFDKLGAQRIFRHLKDGYGFNSLITREVTANGSVISDLDEAPLALGQLSYGVPLRKLTEAYAAFANQGVLCEGRSYISVYDKDGAEIINKGVEQKRIYSPETAQVMNQLLMNVVNDGTARQIRLKESVDVAGKTGTSGNDKDRLFIGYTPYFTGGIWCGFGKDNQPVGNNSPNHLKIWDEVMALIHAELVFDNYSETLRSFDTDKLTIAPYCSLSGLRPTEWCELDDEAEIRLGYFKSGATISNECYYH